MSVGYTNTPDGVMDAAITTVMEQMRHIDSIAGKYRTDLTNALNNIAKVRVEPIEPPQRMTAPELPLPNIDLKNAPQFEKVAFNQPNLPVFHDINDLLSELDLSDLDIPVMPEMPSIQLPDLPGFAEIALPERPDIETDIELPDTPKLDLPELEDLIQLEIPEFTFPELPDFDGNPPNLNGVSVPDVFIAWEEPSNEPTETFEEILALVQEGLKDGGIGLPKDIEQGLFNRARERNSKEIERAVNEAMQDWSTRNYSMPPGMLVKQVAAIRDEGRLSAADTNRDILIEASKYEIDNMRFLVERGIALEQMRLDTHENMAKRMFEVARYNAESQINVFNAQISLFNAQNSAFETLASVYRTKLDGALAKLSAYKTAVDAQVALGQINEQKVQVFKAKIEAVLSNVEMYKALMQGASVRADVMKSKFDVYRSDVQAYSEQINAEKVRVDAYEAQVRGETTKVNMYEAQARAFASTVQAVQSKAEVKTKAIQLKMEAAKTWIQKYTADVDGYKANLQASLNDVQLNTAAFSAQVDAWRASAGMEVSQAEMQSRFADMNVRSNIAYSEMQIKEFETKMQRSIQEAQLALEAAKSVGQYTAQLAAGAMSAAHVSASISGSGSSSASVSRSTSESTSHNYSY